jgi:hypothetical protein
MPIFAIKPKKINKLKTEVKMRKLHLFDVKLRDAMSNEERTITIEATSMIIAIIKAEDLKNTYEYTLEIKMVKL